MRWTPRSAVVARLMRLLDYERDEVAAFRRNLATVEARNSAALTYVRDKQAEIQAKSVDELTAEDVGASTVLVTLRYLLTHDEETGP